jgi:hypothetical protein
MENPNWSLPQHVIPKPRKELKDITLFQALFKTLNPNNILIVIVLS